MTEEAKTQGAVEKLVRYFETQKRNDQPVGLWVGAGVSAAAGIPTLAAIDKGLRSDLGDSAATLEGFALLRAYRAEYGQMGLENALSGIFKGPFAPCALHTSIARLHAAGEVSPLLTTNYDSLLERALEAMPAAFDTVTLEQNISLAAHKRPVLMKLHGDQRDWKSVVLDEESYAEFESTYPLLVKMLDLTLRQRPTVFVGCSMRDPRILDWLTKLPANERKRLHPMRVLLQHPASAGGQPRRDRHRAAPPRRPPRAPRPRRPDHCARSGRRHLACAPRRHRELVIRRAKPAA